MSTKFVGTQEFYDLQDNFDKNYKHLRLDKENKEYNQYGRFYQSGETNKLFEVYMSGYMLGRIAYMD